MKGLAPLFLGIFGTFAFSWVGLTVIPNLADRPSQSAVGRGRHRHLSAAAIGNVRARPQVYAANGCVYCHSQQVRADYAAADIDRKWGKRRSAPRDYIFERPVFLGKMRMGPDLANIGARAPAEAGESCSSWRCGSRSCCFCEWRNKSRGFVCAASGFTSRCFAGCETRSELFSCSPSCLARASRFARDCEFARNSSSAAPATSSGSSPPAGASPAGPKAGPASPSPAAAANAAPGGVTAPSSGPQTQVPRGQSKRSDEPPMYSAAWHHLHLYSPRSINFDSNMPSYRFLYRKAPHQ